MFHIILHNIHRKLTNSFINSQLNKHKFENALPDSLKRPVINLILTLPKTS